jgi:WD40 repeat protein
MFAICCSKRTYITGSGTGRLYNWPGDSTSSKPIAGHQGGKIQTLRAFNDAVYSGGDDGLLLMWKTDANGSVLDKPERVFDVRMAYPNNLSKQFSQNEYGVLSVDFSQDGRLLLVTNGCDILQIDRKPRCEILLSGHCKD